VPGGTTRHNTLRCINSGAQPRNLKKNSMQIKLFTIPVTGGEALTDEMNVFLRSKKILQTEGQLTNHAGGASWCFCIRYIEDGVGKERPKIDYMQVLDAASFKRFSKMRELRKRIASDEAIPAYAVFTDEELAGMAAMEILTIAGVKAVKGIGEKRCEKYGQLFVNIPQ
jgi:superfamily II DNA helicase RecQ